MKESIEKILRECKENVMWIFDTRYVCGIKPHLAKSMALIPN